MQSIFIAIGILVVFNLLMTLLIKYKNKPDKPIENAPSVNNRFFARLFGVVIWPTVGVIAVISDSILQVIVLYIYSVLITFIASKIHEQELDKQ